MFYILKGGRSNTKTIKNSPSYRDHLLGKNGGMNMIDKGSLTDRDINYILDSDDKELKKALDKKYKREKANSEQVQRLYGNDFTNRDNDGNLFKDIATYHPETVGSTKEDVANMKEILNQKTNA